MIQDSFFAYSCYKLTTNVMLLVVLLAISSLLEVLRCTCYVPSTCSSLQSMSAEQQCCWLRCTYQWHATAC